MIEKVPNIAKEVKAGQPMDAKAGPMPSPSLDEMASVTSKGMDPRTIGMK